MKNRKDRIEMMVDLIKHHSIGSQDELSRLLENAGFSVTQATLSRDLKTLRITKVPTDQGGYMYVLPENDSLRDTLKIQGASSKSSAYQSGLISITFSNNIAVIKTRNGYASAFAYDIDMSNTPEILGTVAGTDTIIAVLQEDVSRDKAMQVLSRLLPFDKSVSAYKN